MMFWRTKRREVKQDAVVATTSPLRVGDAAGWRICHERLTVDAPYRTLIAENGKVIWVGSFDDLCNTVRASTQVEAANDNEAGRVAA